MIQKLHTSFLVSNLQTKFPINILKNLINNKKAIQYLLLHFERPSKV